jgi:hypothetical protein
VQLTQIVLTDDQALLTRQLIDIALANSTEEEIGDAADDAMRLAVFFGAVAAEPERFPVTGTMARALKQAQRQAKGPAQPASRRNRRKARQEKRTSFHKRRRKETRETREAYNAAVAAMAAEREEMGAAFAEKRAQLEAEPKVNVTDAMGNVIIAGVPQSMIVPVEPEIEDLGTYIPGSSEQPGGALADDGTFTPMSKIVMPGSAEALQAQLEAKS